MLDIRAGSRVGPYKVIAPLEESTRGGMSTLFLAQLAQVDSTQLLLLKLVPVGEEAGDGGGIMELNALRKEVEILQKLQHPGIVKIYPIFSRDGRRERYISRATNVSSRPWFCTMEYLGGGSLESRLREMAVIPIEEAVEIAYQIGSALDYMHAKGYVHWDVKPDNILFREVQSENGSNKLQAVLTDFGIARSTHEPAVVTGSVPYMSPERVRVHLGEIPTDQVMDQRPADVYALGVVLYEMLAGSLPYAASGEGLKIAILEDAPIPLSDFNYEVPSVLEDIIFQALEKDPTNRPTMDELVTMLDRAVPSPRTGLQSLGSGASADGAFGAAMEPGVRSRPRPRPRPEEKEEPKPTKPQRTVLDWLQQGALIVLGVAIILWLGGQFGVGPLASSEPTPTPSPTPTLTPTLAPAAPEVIGVSPVSASTAEGEVVLTIAGENFRDNPDVALSGSSGDILASSAKVYGGGGKIRCTFDISDAKPGNWSVEVNNSDGTFGELPFGFEIIAPTPTPLPSPTPAPTEVSETPTPSRAAGTPVPRAEAPVPVSPSSGQWVQSPVTFQWRGSLRSGQSYRVVATHESGASTGCTTSGNSCSASIAADKSGAWTWSVSVIQGGSVVESSSQASFNFAPPDGGDNDNDDGKK